MISHSADRPLAWCVRISLYSVMGSLLFIQSRAQHTFPGLITRSCNTSTLTCSHFMEVKQNPKTFRFSIVWFDVSSRYMCRIHAHHPHHHFNTTGKICSSVQIFRFLNWIFFFLFWIYIKIPLTMWWLFRKEKNLCNPPRHAVISSSSFSSFFQLVCYQHREQLYLWIDNVELDGW